MLILQIASGERRCYLHLRWHLNWTVHLAVQVSVSHFSMPFVGENRFRRVLQKRMGSGHRECCGLHLFHQQKHVHIASWAHWALLKQAKLNIKCAVTNCSLSLRDDEQCAVCNVKCTVCNVQCEKIATRSLLVGLSPF